MDTLRKQSFTYRVANKVCSVDLFFDTRGKAYIKQRRQCVAISLEFLGSKTAHLHIQGKTYLFGVERNPEGFRFTHHCNEMVLKRPFETSIAHYADAGNASTIVIQSQMPGLVVAIPVRRGQHVHEGQTVLVLEAMKMQNPLKAPKEGTVEKIWVQQGTTVEIGTALLEIKAKRK